MSALLRAGQVLLAVTLVVTLVYAGDRSLALVAGVALAVGLGALAFTGIRPVLGIAVVAASLVVVGAGLVAARQRTAGTVFTLDAGVCFTRTAGKVRPVECTSTHDAEIVGFIPGTTSGHDYPGTATLTGRAARGCPDEGGTYTLDPMSLPAGIHLYSYLPGRSQWAAQHHDIVCVMATDHPTLTRSVREDPSLLDDTQISFVYAVRDYDTALIRLDALTTRSAWPPLRDAVTAAAQANAATRARLASGDWPSEIQPDLRTLLDALAHTNALWTQAARSDTRAGALPLITDAEATPAHDAELSIRRILGLSTHQGEPHRPH